MQIVDGALTKGIFMTLSGSRAGGGRTSLELAVSDNEPERDAQSWPFYAEDEIAAVSNVLLSGRANQWTGEHVFAFEEEMAAYFQQPYAVALANGTVALELALIALEIGAGDEVIVPSRSFFASAGAVALCGGTPVFADCDADSQNMTVETIAPLITANTKAIILVHLAGWPCDMKGIMALARRKGLYVIEDCAQAHGAMIGDMPVGSFGDAAAFSFCQDKIMSTGGEGGIALFADETVYRRAWSYKDHGKSFDKVRTPSEKIGFRYLHAGLGTNWRMTEMQAAIGRIQLRKLDDWVSLRNRNAGIWFDALEEVDALRVPRPPSNVTHAFYKAYAFLKPEMLKPQTTRSELLSALSARGLPAFTGACPEIYREGAFNHLRVPTRKVTQELGQTSLMFEVHPTLDPNQLRDRAKDVAHCINEFTA